MDMLTAIIGGLTDRLWSVFMLVVMLGTGIYFSVRLGFFQLVHHREMWRSIFGDKESGAGTSPFVSFSTTMAARIGAGNIAGVALAIYRGGPGALFWMLLITVTNAAISFVEGTLAQLYKIKSKGEYRNSNSGIAERGLGSRRCGTILAIVTLICVALFMPAAATFTIANGFRYALNFPLWLSALLIAAGFVIVIMFRGREIAKINAYVVPFMTFAYLLMSLLILAVKAREIPAAISLIAASAFGKGALVGGIEGSLLAAVSQGVRRATFSQAAGMGETVLASAQAEECHPIDQGLAGAAGSFLDTAIVCMSTGLVLVITDCYNLAPELGAYLSPVAKVAQLDTVGVGFVQASVESVIGSLGPIFVATMLLLFSFTSIVAYYYEAESAARFLFFHEEAKKQHRRLDRLIRICMVLAILLWGSSNWELAWNASDLALAICTLFNLLVLWKLFPRTADLYRDYRRQKAEGRKPIYDPDQPGMYFPGVELELWRSIRDQALISEETGQEETEE